MSVRSYPSKELSPEIVQAIRERHAADTKRGGPPRSIADVIGGEPARQGSAGGPVNLTSRYLRRRGGDEFGQAAYLTAQAALAEPNPERKATAHAVATVLRGLAGKAAQLEFDLWRGGNVLLGDEFHDAIRDRLIAHCRTFAVRSACQCVLSEIIRWLEWQNWMCRKTSVEIADRLKLSRGQMGRIVQILESPAIGAITRKKRGRVMIIMVNPEGAYRGKEINFLKVIGRYRTEEASRPDRLNGESAVV